MKTDLVVTHDPIYGLSYIYLVGGIGEGAAVRQLIASDNIILDFDADGHLLGVELLDPKLLHPTLLERAVSPWDE